MLGQLEATGGQVVIADMEAGTGTLTRLPEGSLDLVLLVTEPSVKSVEVSRRAAQIVAERQIGPMLLVANRVRDAADVELIRAGLPSQAVHIVPDDPQVTLAERDGRSVLDSAPEAPAVAAARQLAGSLRAPAGIEKVP